MYPFSSDRPYVRNAWYMAAWADEIGDRPLGRTILEQPIVFFRDREGAIVALFGLCAHRYYPLADADVVDGQIQCPYHGFTYDADGTCTRIPGQDQTPARFRQRTYPIMEKFGMVWVWMGDAGVADPESFPPLEEFGFGQPGWTWVPNGMTPMNVRWSLILDNVMDLSHVGFLHNRSINAPHAGEVRPQMRPGRHLSVARMMPAQSNVAYANNAFPENREPLDCEFNSTFLSPGLVMTGLRIYRRDENDKPEMIGDSYHMQAVTPRDRAHSHFFSCALRTWAPNSTAFDQWIRTAIAMARAEDREALEAIELQIDRFGNARTELAGINDFAALKMRRALDAMLHAEEGAEKAGGGITKLGIVSAAAV